MSKFCFKHFILAFPFLPLSAYAAVSIGSPVDNNAPYKFNKNNILVKITLIECYKKETNILNEGAVKTQHIACGEDAARVLLKKRMQLSIGQEVMEEQEQELTSFNTLPTVELVNGSYQLRPNPKAQTFKNEAKVMAYLSEWSENEISFSVHANVLDHQTHTSNIARTSTGGVFTNPTPRVRHRVMVTDATLKPGESDVFSGDVWVSQPEGEGISKRLPASGRLWVEIEALHP